MSPQHTKDSSIPDMEKGDSPGRDSQDVGIVISPENCDCTPWIIAILIGIIRHVCAQAFLYLVVLSPVFTLLAPVVVPLLIIAFLVVRLLQFIRSGDGFNRAIHLKYIILSWIFLFALEILSAMGILIFPIATYAPFLKHVVLGGLPLKSWLNIICIICGLYCLGYCLALFMNRVLQRIHLKNIVCSLYIQEAVSDIFNCLIFWWAESKVTEYLPPKLKQIRVWIEAGIFALIGYNTITLCTHVIVWFLRASLRALDQNKPDWYEDIQKLLHKKYLVYCADGVRGSISFILTSVLLLLMWVLYLGSRLKGTNEAEVVMYFGTRTLVSLLICSFLWLIKTFVLLAWEANAVYSRIYDEMFKNAKNLYFLRKIGLIEDNQEETYQGIAGWIAVKFTSSQSKHYEMVKDDLCLPRPWDTTLHDIQQAAQHFLVAKDKLSRNILISIMHPHLQSKTPARSDSPEVDLDYLKKLLNCKENFSNSKQAEESDSDAFIKMLQGNENVHSSQEKISLDKIQSWMEKAQRMCLFLANTVISGKDAADCLNTIMSVVIIFATFLMWLLITGLASTKALVLIASPLLAASFIFGDTCKSLFQGIIFVYVVRPFDVGDTCNIGDYQKLLLVKTIGVWKTTFTLTDKGDQEVIYPNSELAKLRVINHKIRFDGTEPDQSNCSKEDSDAKGKEATILQYAMGKSTVVNGAKLIAEWTAANQLNSGKEVAVLKHPCATSTNANAVAECAARADNSSAYISTRPESEIELSKI